MNTLYDTIGVVGAGAMGRGIAQIAAQAGRGDCVNSFREYATLRCYYFELECPHRSQ